MTANRAYQGVLEKIIPRGKHGPYAVVRSDDLGIVTFSLDKPIWNERQWPEPGTFILLSDISRKRAGWRAQSARLVRPEDESNQ